jgi:hypothetical protein
LPLLAVIRFVFVRFHSLFYRVNPIFQKGSRGFGAAAAEQEAAEQAAQAAGELPEETLKALQASHDLAIGIALKTAEIGERDRDMAQELANADDEAVQEQAPEPRGLKRRKQK